MKDFNLPTIKGIDINSILLIIGSAKTNNRLGEIVHVTSYKELVDTYGNCDLVESVKIAKQNNVKNVFVANAKAQNDYLNIATIAAYYNFSYIVLLDKYLSDTFYDSFNNKSIYYVDLLLSYIESDTTIFVTDYKASLYEDIDSYLIDMNNKYKEYLNYSSQIKNNSSNLVFVLNNISSTIPANFYVCTSLIISETNKYPDLIDTFDTIFDLDNWDINFNGCYIKNINNNCTIENFINFNDMSKIERFVPIDRIVKNIKRELDLSEYSGRLYNDVLIVNIYKKLEEYLYKKINTCIQDFVINSIYPIVTEDNCVILILDFTIIPLFTIESYRYVIEV